MQIYGVPVSPFVQRVLMTVRAKSAEVPLNTMPGMALQSPEFQAISPMGRIPVLELDDGTRICESVAIAAYLDETLPGPSIMPEDPVARAQVRAISAIADLEVAAGVRPAMVYQVFKYGNAPELVAAGELQYNKGLDAIEKLRNKEHRYAVGSSLTPADCTLIPVLTLMELIDPVTGTGKAFKARSGLAAYFERMKADPVASITVSEMTAGFAAMMQRNA